MNDLIETENGRTIIIDGEVRLADYKVFWREKYAKELPNILIFWGILAVGALALAFLFRGGSFGQWFFLFAGFVVLVPILLSFYNYYGFMTEIKKYIASLSEREKYFNLIIKENGTGIESVQGDNFSFLSWDSFRSAVEKETYFSLHYRTSPFLIMKSEFKDAADIALFRKMLADKFGANAKLLR